MTLERLPMFPLPTPLLPGMGLPLQVFESRYHVMMEHVMGTGGGRFGVALITRGGQVGGGDLRSLVGTVAEVLRHQQLGDGRQLILAVGRERIRIERWLRDDPYPLAEVEEWPDESAPAGVAVPAGEASLGRIDIQGHLDDIVALVSARMEQQDRHQLFESSNLPRNLDLAIWQATIVADLGALDRQRLLECPGPDRRLPLLVDMLDERRDVLAFTLDDHT